MVVAVVVFTGAEAAASMGAEASGEVASTVVVAGSGDTTAEGMVATAGVLSADTTAAGTAGTVGRTVVIAADRAMAGGDLEELAVRLVECVAARPCVAPGHQGHGHLTGAAAFAAALLDGIHFREGVMEGACLRDPPGPEWRAGLAQAE